MSIYNTLPLGKQILPTQRYDPSLLRAVPRYLQRQGLRLCDHPLPFSGEDIWMLYELSWLDQNGLPQVAIAEVRFDAHTVALVESKSFKLYLHSLNNTHFPSWHQVKQTLLQDLSHCAGGAVQVTLFSLSAFTYQPLTVLEGLCLEEQVPLLQKEPIDLQQLVPQRTAAPVMETLVTHLLRSNCPVTQQPDWGSLQIHYRGAPIDHQQLLTYLVTFRSHYAFHEQCVEQIFCDLMHYCRPTHLTVLARYTRRGGLEINPFRTNWQTAPVNQRLARQ